MPLSLSRKRGEACSKDIVPLVDNSELQQQDEGGGHIIEVVLAVVELRERAAFQQRVSTVSLLRVGEVSIELHFVFEQLHPHHGKDVIYYLRNR